ncbi:hypothetical protein ACFLV7_08505 [Chloroflexota bacterium]
MNVQRWLHILFSMLIVYGVTVFLSGCAEGTPGPNAWIDHPGEGSLVVLGESQTVISHAFAPQGIAEAVLFVNGEALSKGSPPDSLTDFSEISYEWTSQSEGLQTLQIVAYATTGEEIRSDPVTVNVVREPPTVTPSTVLSTTLDTPTVPTTTVVETPPPTTTVVDTPTPTGTPTPVIQFWAEPSTLNAGECTTIRWNVENVRTVIFGGTEQPFDGSNKDCLCSDQSYTLTIIHFDNRQEKRQVDVTVSGACETPTPPDNTPPPVPEPIVPADQQVLACKAAQNLVWKPVSDPSGVAGYYVRLERRSDPNAGWNPVNVWGLINDKQHTVNVTCGYYYRWGVQAKDSIGNTSNWSGWSEFSVTLE